ncbi:MAG: hypothetical protein SFT92_06495 [Rickettsiales bacterium]|nr:hypothetical protein [Rickettsiales bacterium]
MKHKETQKKLLQESGVFLAVLVVLSGLSYFLNVLSDDYAKEINELERQTTETVMEANKLKDQFLKVQANSGLYREAMQKILGEQLSISNRQAIRVKFEELKTRFFLSNVRLTVSAVQDVPGHNYKSLKDAVVKSEVVISADALTDEDIYSFMDALQTELPGITQVNQFSITRASRPTDAALRNIVDTGQFLLVSSNIKFNWFGLKDLGIAPVTNQHNSNNDTAGQSDN